MSYSDLTWQCRWSPYRHVGVFPEQAVHWDWMREVLRTSINNTQTAICKKSTSEDWRLKIGDQKESPKILNLFAYT